MWARFYRQQFYINVQHFCSEKEQSVLNILNIT